MPIHTIVKACQIIPACRHLAVSTLGHMPCRQTEKRQTVLHAESFRHVLTVCWTYHCRTHCKQACSYTCYSWTMDGVRVAAGPGMQKSRNALPNYVSLGLHVYNMIGQAKLLLEAIQHT